MLWQDVTRVTPPLTSLPDIERAATRIRGTVVRTPLIDVSRQSGRPLWLKAENLQMAGSFKIRGAYNLISSLAVDSRRRGVITYSSGNHGQAVAYAARGLGVPAVVVMPVTAPDVKITGAQHFGAEVLTEGTTSIARQARAEHEANVRGFVVVPPFDHLDIIAGQATVGSEILEDCPGVACVYVPIGGGGLAAGVGAAVKQVRPDVKVVGVEPVGAATMTASLDAGRPVALETVSSVTDGLLPARPGDLTFAHAHAFVDAVVTVSDDAIEQAVAWLFRHAKLVVEPSGAASVAAALSTSASSLDAPSVAVVSGGNISGFALSGILERVGQETPARARAIPSRRRRR